MPAQLGLDQTLCEHVTRLHREEVLRLLSIVANKLRALARERELDGYEKHRTLTVVYGVLRTRERILDQPVGWPPDTASELATLSLDCSGPLARFRRYIDEAGGLARTNMSLNASRPFLSSLAV